MARSSSIYVVTKPLSNHLLAAFTVKHELATWLYLRYDKDVTVTRMGDGALGGDASKLTNMPVRPLARQGYEQAHARWERTVPQYRGEEPQPPT